MDPPISPTYRDIRGSVLRGSVKQLEMATGGEARSQLINNSDNFDR